MKIRRLKSEEHSRTRKMWEEIFTEDTKAFLDYYYSVKTKENQIYVAEEGEEIRAMLQLNPYRMQIGDTQADTSYIIAVATDVRYRHQGLMAGLLRQSMNDMYRNGMPFTFLMPAAEAIYLPFDFRFVYAQEQSRVAGQPKAAGVEENSVEILEAEEKDTYLLAEFATDYLKDRYEICTVRDAHYYEVLLKEQRSENGGIKLVKADGKIVGCFAYAKGEAYEIREPLFAEGYEKYFSEAVFCLTGDEKTEVNCYGYGNGQRFQTKPVIMVRILHLQKLLGMMCTKEKMALVLTIEDPIIEENNGTFRIRGCEGGIETEREETEKSEGTIKIADLTSFLFGYKSLETLETEGVKLSKKVKEELPKIQNWTNIYINEVV